MQNDIDLTIICVTYNHSKYIKQTLQSFINQKTRYKIEIIVHDDASTDNTQQIVLDTMCHSNIVFFPIFEEVNQLSKGISPFETIIPYIHGKYIALCEGDDCWCDDNKIERCLTFLNQNPSYGSCVHATKVFNTKLGKYDREIKLEPNVEKDYSFYDALLNNCHFSSIVCTKDIYCKRSYNFFHSVKYVEDHPLKIVMALNGKIRYFPSFSSVYRIFSSPDSWTSKTQEKYDSLQLQYKKNNLVLLWEVKKEVGWLNKKLVNKRIKELYWSVFCLTHDIFYYKRPLYFFTVIIIAIKRVLLKIRSNSFLA